MTCQTSLAAALLAAAPLSPPADASSAGGESLPVVEFVYDFDNSARGDVEGEWAVFAEYGFVQFTRFLPLVGWQAVPELTLDRYVLGEDLIHRFLDAELDGDRLAVSLSIVNGGANGVIVFEWDGTTWGQLGSTITSPAPKSEGSFGGYDLALEGDVLVVSDANQAGTGVWKGAVHVYEWDGSSWVLGTSLAPPIDGSGFGSELSMDGGLLAVTQPHAFPPSGDVGAVHIYTGGGGSWTHADTLFPFPQSGNGEFASDVAVDNGRVAVGAHYYEADGASTEKRGAVYSFVQQDGAWVVEALLQVPEPEFSYFFGLSVDMAAGRLLVGASPHPRSYELAGGAWTDQGFVDELSYPFGYLKLSSDGVRSVHYQGGPSKPESIARFESLPPLTCQTDLGSQGPGSAQLQVCGEGLATALDLNTLLLETDVKVKPTFLALSLPGNPDLSLLGGTFVSGTGLLPSGLFAFSTDGDGDLALTVLGQPTAIDLVVQCATLDVSQPLGWTVSNAVLLQYGQ
ncbi:hypothetical protein [Engelhardtia mirabilis]|uniref:FG-GAP repeat protein n=1 Tax=Engelhardtia mirabilis TaxID=2528011 RepID=A0A518BS29_9BACT|nr:hypothetical protein Pla133_48920 [Planctomycetes bacterium Pla133]QDV04096.1 hypothetical protein Pla86_48900 [Planctomycetes bacterium Pla86]